MFKTLNRAADDIEKGLTTWTWWGINHPRSAIKRWKSNLQQT